MRFLASLIRNRPAGPVIGSASPKRYSLDQITIAVLVLFAIYAVVYSTVVVPKNATSIEVLAQLINSPPWRQTRGKS